MRQYMYGMRLRGFAPFCQPMKGLVMRIDDEAENYWDILIYSRKLSEEELKQYELDFLGERIV